jgi:FKBP-type peptidyl-prolyl cis-trans isomerases 1
MTNKLLTKAFLGLAFSAMMVSCQNSAYPGYEQTDNELYYKFITKNEGETVKMGDVMTLDFAYFVNDSLLSSTNGATMNDKLRESLYPGDLYEGLAMMHKGDSVSLLMRADSLFTVLFGFPQLPEFINPEDMVRWEIKMIDFLPEEQFLANRQAEQDAAIQNARAELTNYLTENGISAVPTESGLVYVSTVAGKGVRPQAGQKVRVHYTGKLLDGTVFDSSVERGEPFEFILGQGQVIPGWDEGIALLKKGGKGILYIPTDLGYSFQQAGTIPPYSNLIFEVELIDFE